MLVYIYVYKYRNLAGTWAGNVRETLAGGGGLRQWLPTFHRIKNDSILFFSPAVLI